MVSVSSDIWRPFYLSGLWDRRRGLIVLYGELPIDPLLKILNLWKNLQFERLITIFFRSGRFEHEYLTSFFLMDF